VGLGDVDVEICRGLFDFRGVLGHEFVATVESVAGGDRRGLTGRRVVGTVNVACGGCDMCRKGLAAHCRRQTVLGQRGRDGCLADCFVLPGENLVPVPDSLDDDHAVFAYTLAAALQSVRQLTIEGKPYITVLGDAPLGLLTAQVMAKLNASVRVIGRDPQRLALCERWGVKHRHLDEIGRRADQDVVVDCTGRADGLTLALQLVRPRGTVLLKSPLARAAMNGTVDLTTVVTSEVVVAGSSGGPIGEAVAMLERDEVDVISLLGRRMRLDDGPAVLHAAAEPRALKVIVEV
jgi:threonine dehydrogenase-like Zn-dependent dehydrogenase